MAAKYGVLDAIVPVGTRSEAPIVCVGRICTATEASDGRINAKSVLLEGIMSEGESTRRTDPAPVCNGHQPPPSAHLAPSPSQAATVWRWTCRKWPATPSSPAKLSWCGG